MSNLPSNYYETKDTPPLYNNPLTLNTDDEIFDESVDIPESDRNPNLIQYENLLKYSIINDMEDASEDYFKNHNDLEDEIFKELEDNPQPEYKAINKDILKINFDFCKTCKFFEQETIQGIKIEYGYCHVPDKGDNYHAIISKNGYVPVKCPYQLEQTLANELKE